MQKEELQFHKTKITTLTATIKKIKQDELMSNLNWMLLTAISRKFKITQPEEMQRVDSSVITISKSTIG